MRTRDRVARRDPGPSVRMAAAPPPRRGSQTIRPTADEGPRICPQTIRPHRRGTAATRLRARLQELANWDSESPLRRPRKTQERAVP